MKTLDQIQKNVIPKQTAIDRAKNWRNYMEKHNDLIDIKAFNISKDDLMALLNEGGVKSVRAYLGINENNQVDLLLVGVNKEIGEGGKDMIDYENGDYIYDLTTPCPAMCDENSPLNIK